MKDHRCCFEEESPACGLNVVHRCCICTKRWEAPTFKPFYAQSDLDQAISRAVEEKVKKIREDIEKLTTYDHAKCPFPNTCVGYQNCVSDIDNYFASLNTKEDESTKKSKL